MDIEIHICDDVPIAFSMLGEFTMRSSFDLNMFWSKATIAMKLRIFGFDLASNREVGSISKVTPFTSTVVPRFSLPSRMSESDEILDNYWEQPKLVLRDAGIIVYSREPINMFVDSFK
jgi:hypothetical protein